MQPQPPRCRVGLVQINNSFSGQNYLPYAVGLLEAHVRRYAGSWLGKSAQRDKWRFCLTAARMAA